MRTLLPLLGAAVLLGSCAPLLSTAAQLAQQGPSSPSAGPLEIGQTWAITGLVNAENVAFDAPVTQLVGEPRQAATLAARDETAAFAAGRAGTNVVKYDATGVPTLKFVWVGRTVERRPYVYTCTITDPLSQPYQGTLTLDRGEPTPLRGSCTAQLKR
ncbi:hypothetical protein [Deinococcus maricopensis]|nr:hypothetical protein [Deinococcus maricopensis]